MNGDFVQTNIPQLVKNKKTGVIESSNQGEYSRQKALREKTKWYARMERDIQGIQKNLALINEKLGITV